MPRHQNQSWGGLDLAWPGRLQVSPPSNFVTSWSTYQPSTRTPNYGKRNINTTISTRTASEPACSTRIRRQHSCPSEGIFALAPNAPLDTGQKLPDRQFKHVPPPSAKKSLKEPKAANKIGPPLPTNRLLLDLTFLVGFLSILHTFLRSPRGAEKLGSPGPL